MTQVAVRYAWLVRVASLDAMNVPFDDGMPLTNGWMVMAATIDTVHHAGQIVCIIQNLPSDSEMNLDELAMSDWAVP